MVYSRDTTSAMAERPPFFPDLALLDIANDRILEVSKKKGRK
jgi:hypothetical protein